MKTSPTFCSELFKTLSEEDFIIIEYALNEWLKSRDHSEMWLRLKEVYNKIIQCKLRFLGFGIIGKCCNCNNGATYVSLLPHYTEWCSKCFNEKEEKENETHLS